MNFDENNKAVLIGEIYSDYMFSHSASGIGYYFVDVGVQRFSGYVDVIPVMIMESMVDVQKSDIGKIVSVEGMYHSYNRHMENRIKLDLYIFALCFQIVENSWIGESDNEVLLKGYVCKSPVYRKSPLGREITDIFIAVHRNNGKSDYIPCVLWGVNARNYALADIGTYVELVGRIQSRNYIKKHDDGNIETRIAYEISVSEIE